MSNKSDLKLQTNLRRLRARAPLSLCFESFGVRVLIESNNEEALEVCRQLIREALPNCHSIVPHREAEHRFTLVWNPSGRDSLYKDGNSIALGIRRKDALAMLAPRLRLTVAEFAVDHVFIHAGVVAWKGKAVLIPGDSMQGKTTLVSELIKRGAVYYSDEYAILDKQGRVHPFAKTLSVRNMAGDTRQIEYSASALGAATAAESAEVGMVLISRYQPAATWQPEVLTPGQGVVELVRNTIPIRRDPQFALSVLKKSVEGAVSIKSVRSEASEVADWIIDHFETKRSKTSF